jgi:SAM-dependent methyltransferase
LIADAGERRGRPAFELPDGWRPRLAADQETVFSRFRQLCRPAGAEVLEIGGRLDDALVADSGVATWWAIDPRNPEADPGAPAESTVRSLRGVASSTPLPDRSVDLIFSSNAFQHVQDLAATLAEVARVLRPGGILYANYGPVWSAPDGSHVEDLSFEGRRYDFWEGALMPSHAHLVLDEPELVELLTPIHGPGLARALAGYVHRSDWINRLFFDDYACLFTESPLEVVAFGGCSDFDYNYRPPATAGPLAERFRPDRVADEVRARHGGDLRDLASRDVEVVLRAPGGS